MKTTEQWGQLSIKTILSRREDEPMNHDLETIVATLVASGKGILAADETVPTLTRRFDTLGIQSTEESRRTYREMLFTAAGLDEFISGAIMYDETMRQRSAGGRRFPKSWRAMALFRASRLIRAPSH